MITPSQIADAYDAFLKADNAQFQAEEDRIQKSIEREEKMMAAINEAIADGVTDPGRQQQKAQRATRGELTWLRLAELESRKAQHAARQAGIVVDSLNKQLEAEKLALQK